MRSASQLRLWKNHLKDPFPITPHSLHNNVNFNKLFPGKALNYLLCNKHVMSRKFYYIAHCGLMAPHGAKIPVRIGSCNSLPTDDTMPLSEPMSIPHQLGPVLFNSGSFPKRDLTNQSLQYLKINHPKFHSNLSGNKCNATLITGSNFQDIIIVLTGNEWWQLLANPG